MQAVAALVDSRSALGALRRSLPRRGSAPVLACRSPAGLGRALAGRLLEAVVLGTRAARRVDLPALFAKYPGVPLVLYGAVRPDDGELLLGWHKLEVAAVVVEGVDDAVVGDLVLRNSATSRRRMSLAAAPAALRLTEPLQRRAWDRLVGFWGRPPRTAKLAADLGVSREHLSRQFGAGGAPNLKRVSDFIAVSNALSLLRNPGYDLASVARLLDFATPSHLRLVVRRIAGVPAPQAVGFTEKELLARFQRVGARSRG